MMGGADWDSKWWLSIDLCTKCNFIWGREGGRVSARGQLPSAPSGYATSGNQVVTDEYVLVV